MHSYLSSFGASPPFGQHQIIHLSKWWREAKVHKQLVHAKLNATLCVCRTRNLSITSPMLHHCDTDPPSRQSHMQMFFTTGGSLGIGTEQHCQSKWLYKFIVPDTFCQASKLADTLCNYSNCWHFAAIHHGPVTANAQPVYYYYCYSRTTWNHRRPKIRIYPLLSGVFNSD